LKDNKSFDLSSAALHLLAMGCMLCDHLWATVVPGNNWLTCVGRLAFPIFAFLIVEGYFHTRNLKNYVLRLLVLALVAEIPFNLMYAGRLFYPIHQNVIWTFLISLGLIHWNEKAKSAPLWRRILRGASTVIVGMLAGTLTFVDYYGAGVAMVLVFYFCRGSSLPCRLGQLLGLGYINMEILGGLGYELTVLGRTIFLAQQGLALLALIPIWLYRGRQGHKSTAFRWLCYGFYPAHMLLLALGKLL